MNTTPLLHIERLSVAYRQEGGWVPAVEDVSLTIEPGETLALVGESGCGKSTLGLAITRLTPPAARISGEVRFHDEHLLRCHAAALRRVRGGQIAYVFQDPATSLNPVMTVGDQLAEVLQLHGGASGSNVRERAAALLTQVGITAPQERLRSYPHELSGGMQQRVMIAMAVACKPQLLIADEPTTALDVTIQVQILELLRRLRAELGLAVLLITHDLSVVERTADRVAVMYAGRIVEQATARRLFERPAHPYTRGLLDCLPRLADIAKHRQPHPIPGQPPRLDQRPAGCLFHPRCAVAETRCREAEPSLDRLEDDQWARCIKPYSTPKN